MYNNVLYIHAVFDIRLFTFMSCNMFIRLTTLSGSIWGTLPSIVFMMRLKIAFQGTIYKFVATYYKQQIFVFLTH